MIRHDFKNCHVEFIGDIFSALERFEKKKYQIVVCEFYLGAKNWNGVHLLSRAKFFDPEVKTILLAKDFARDCEGSEFSDTKIIQAADCIWEWKSLHRKKRRKEKIERKINGFLGENESAFAV